MDAYAVNSLKAVTFRISATSAKQLPAIIPRVTATLPVCRPVLSSSHSSSAKDASEAAVLVHKFRTQISTLLQDRSVEGRWSAAVLVKSAVELGGWEMLQKCAPWVRGLLGILTKPDPPTSKALTIVTLTRIFMLTRDYQTLVREITTPSLTPFITSCMNILSRFKSADPGAQQLVETILESFTRLLPRHPTTFRPHLSKISQFLGTVVASGGQNSLTAVGLAAARNLYTQLPCCGAKGASKEQWEKIFQSIIAATHQTADKVFRAVIEDWDSVTGVQPPRATTRTMEQEVQQLEPDLAGFPGWAGIYAGSGRLIGLLELLADFTTAPTPSNTSVNFRLAHIMDLLTRVLSITAPATQGRRNQESVTAFNDQIGKEERNDLWTVLPHIHVAAIDIFEALVDRYGQALVPLMDFFLERLTYLFQEEKSLAVVRTATYSVLARILPFVGSTTSAPQLKSLNLVIHACCDDLLPRENHKTAAQPSSTPAVNGNKNMSNGSINADTFLETTRSKPLQQPQDESLQESAHALLPLLLTHLPAHAVAVSVRSRMESTAVLIQHEKALLASVLNATPRDNPSLLPLLARLHPDSPHVEALLRPRLPPIKVQNRDGLNVDLEEEDSEEEEQEDSSDKVDERPVGEDDQMELDGAPATRPNLVEAEQPITEQKPPAAGTRSEVRPSNSRNGPRQNSREGSEKRPSIETAPELPSPKRLRVSSPPSRVVQEQEQKASAAPAAAAATTTYTGEDAEDDDEDVEIPTLVMGDDDEDEESEVEG